MVVKEHTVLTFWNHMSAPILKEQMNDFITKTQEKISKTMHLSLFCNARNTDISMLAVFEREYPNYSVYHASPLAIVKRMCAEMIKQAAYYDEPGWIVLISDADDYRAALIPLLRDGWKFYIVYPSPVDSSFLDYADESISMDALLSPNSLNQILYESRTFLMQIPKLTPTQLAEVLEAEQQCVYFSKSTRDAVIVIKAGNNKEIQKSLKRFIERICVMTGAQPADVLPLPPYAFPPVVTGPGPGPCSHHLLITCSPRHLSNAIPNHQMAHSNQQRANIDLHPSSIDSHCTTTQSDYGVGDMKNRIQSGDFSLRDRAPHPNGVVVASEENPPNYPPPPLEQPSQYQTVTVSPLQKPNGYNENCDFFQNSPMSSTNTKDPIRKIASLSPVQTFKPNENRDAFAVGAAELMEREKNPRLQKNIGGNRDPFAIGAAELMEREKKQRDYYNGRPSQKIETFNQFDSLTNLSETSVKSGFELVDYGKIVEGCDGKSDGFKGRLDHVNLTGGNSWKQAAGRFMRENDTLQHKQSTISQFHLNLPNAITPSHSNGGSCNLCDSLPRDHDVGNMEIGGNRCDQKPSQSGYLYLPLNNKPGVVNQGQQKERFRKPAPQCVYWENPRHRQLTGCTLWHPREICRFYPTCAHRAHDCGFAHPFCGPKCLCPPAQRHPQINHWTEDLQKYFGAPQRSSA